MVRLQACIRKNECTFSYKRKYFSILKDTLENTNSSKNIIMSGLRYVGKTVILQQLAKYFKETSLLFDMRYVKFRENESAIDFYTSMEDYIIDSIV